VSFRHLFKWLSRRSRLTISKTEAISIARDECEKRKWTWREPVKVQSRWGIWIVHTNWGYRGVNARIAIDQETGEVTEAAYLPR
jgi:hypothetical protein